MVTLGRLEQGLTVFVPDPTDGIQESHVPPSGLHS